MHSNSQGRGLVPLVLILVSCASTSRAGFVDQMVFEDFAFEQVREATRKVLEEVAHPRSLVRARPDRVVTEGRFGVCGRDVVCGSGTQFIRHDTGTPWTTVEVGLRKLNGGTAIRVNIEFETLQHCGDGYAEVTCLPEELGSTGFLERLIIEGIRAHLEAKEDFVAG